MRRNVIKSMIFILGASLSVGGGIFAGSNVAEAYTLRNHSIDSPSAARYWIDSSVTQNGFSSVASHGSTAWNGTRTYSTYVNATQTSDASIAHAKWYASAPDNDLGGIFADTNWTFGVNSRSVVRINTPKMKTLSVAERNETAAHEMGHVYGLGHEDSVEAIMVSEGFIKKQYPVQDDKDGIYHLYIGF